MIDYIFYTIVSLGCSFLVYFLILKNQKTFQFNRFFLVATLILCLSAPILEFEYFNSVPSITEISLQSKTNETFSEETLKGEVFEIVQISNHWYANIFWYLYILVTVFFLFRFIKNLTSIVRLTKQPHTRIGNLKLIKVKGHKNASSFFNYLFINSEDLKDSLYAKSAIKHENIHCNQLHTLDILLIELLLCVFWFNPFVWLYKKIMLQNHEFVADNLTIQSGIGIEDYSNAIINSGNMEYRVPLTSGFNFIQIKNRIIMLHQSKSSVLKRTLKITTAVLLFTGIFMLSSFKDLKKPLIVVVDAAHGGKDSGQLNEKDIVLNVTKQLSRLSDEKIKIITIRDEDKFLSLKDRVKFVNAQNADVMISLHCNSAKGSKANGVEVYCKEIEENDKNDMSSYGYGSLLMNQQLKNKITDKGVMKTANFYLLKNIKCPGVIVELGFLSNEKDKNRLNNTTHQQDIAKALYDGLLEIRDKK